MRCFNQADSGKSESASYESKEEDDVVGDVILVHVHCQHRTDAHCEIVGHAIVGNATAAFFCRHDVDGYGGACDRYGAKAEAVQTSDYGEQ